MSTRLIKRAGETRQYTFDFSQFPEIAGGDTLTGVATVSATNLNSSSTDIGPTLGNPTILAGGKTVSCVISGGTDGNTWRMECTCNTVGGFILICTGQLTVSED